MTRYFPTDWPVFLNRGEARVHFVTLAVGSSVNAFRFFLRDHERLLARLPAWTVLTVSPNDHHGFEACQTAFNRFYRPKRRYPLPPFHPSAQHPPAIAEDLERYFKSRAALEAGDVASVSTADLDQYREARTRFVGPAVERQFRIWRARTMVADRIGEPVPRLLRPDLPNPVAEGRGEFRAHRLPMPYRQFGDLAGDV